LVIKDGIQTKAHHQSAKKVAYSMAPRVMIILGYFLRIHKESVSLHKIIVLTAEDSNKRKIVSK
jgi:hypothetical protein